MYWIRTTRHTNGGKEPIFINLAICTDATPGRCSVYRDPNGNRLFEPFALHNDKWQREDQDVRKLTLTLFGIDGENPRRLTLYDEAALEVMKHLETLNQMAEDPATANPATV